MNMKQLIYAIVIFYVFVACKPEPPLATKTVVVLYDLSASVDKTSLENYETFSNLIFDKLQQGDVMLGAKISENSITERNHICELKLPLFEPTSTNTIIKNQEKITYDKMVSSKTKEAKTSLHNTLFEDHSSVNKTDILSAIKASEQIFNTYPASKQILVICSDMLEAEETVNFEKKNPDKAFLDNLIKSQTSKGTFPNLKNITVIVEGANAGNNDQFFAVQNFWIEYFKATGASIEKQNYAAHLTEF
ncbi:MAG: hypothetical protein KBF31_05645 [Chitinophagales bacterium]|nr:hypothetical protein [Chitinophagales bacterium]